MSAMTTSAAPAPAPAAAPSDAADAAADAASAARSAAVPKLAEDEDCGFCAYMRAGPCGETFTAWEDCVKLHQERNEDFAKKCVGATQGVWVYGVDGDHIVALMADGGHYAMDSRDRDARFAELPTLVEKVLDRCGQIPVCGVVRGQGFGRRDVQLRLDHAHVLRVLGGELVLDLQPELCVLVQLIL